jgi:lysophospholipase L1-like esterase
MMILTRKTALLLCLFMLCFRGVADENPVKVAIAGDSTVSNYRPGGIIAGWGQEIKLFLNDSCKIENLAVGGRSTKTFIEEGRWSKLLAGNPRFALIQFGHNDSHAKDKPEATDANGNYMDFLRKYADDAKNASITPVFITPVHRRVFDKSGAPTTELKQYADAMKAIAAEKGVFCVDLYESSGKLFASLGESGTAPLFCKPEDRSHFSPEGAYTIAKLVADALKDQDSPLKDYVRVTPLPLPANEIPKLGAKPMPCASIHIFGVTSKTPLEFNGGSDGVSGSSASWMSENADQRLVVTTQPVTSEWTRCHFTFTPKRTGVVTLILMGDMKDQFVCYDDVELIGGAAIDNGSFEYPRKWSPLGKPVLVSEPQKAHGGKLFAKCTSDDRLNQDITVEAWNPVTVSFWIKAD